MKLIHEWWQDMDGCERLITVSAAAAIVLILGIPICQITGVPFHYSDGEMTGVVVKLSHKGIVWKTWEGELNLGAMPQRGEDWLVPVIWKFSVSDESLVRRIQEAARQGRRVTMRYDQPFVLSWSKGSSRYLVVGLDEER